MTVYFYLLSNHMASLFLLVPTPVPRCGVAIPTLLMRNLRLRGAL